MKWLTAVLLALAAVLGGLLIYKNVSPTPQGGTALDAPIVLPALRLVNERGETASLSDSGGRLRLVFFGFARCPDVCPATLARLKNDLAGLTPAQRERVQVQLVTVDPEHDRPNVLRDYLGRFDPTFTGLTGDAAIIDEAARVMFVANIAPLPEPEGHGDHLEHTGAQGGSALSSEDHSDEVPGGANVAARVHGDQVSVVDTRGRFVRVYGNANVTGGELRRDLPALIRLYGS
ncbi:electron transporter [Deinococcus aetherius]|uniref:Electron transporter n=1 Tax=Deinococcus aetherius TaxID=200252 RepID=A0ABN6RJL9_9DEIO|nr:SCO family protein [Deinococcus aetherius]BDP43020.1 electron transporter [Deinococcus aetherius]